MFGVYEFFSLICDLRKFRMSTNQEKTVYRGPVFQLNTKSKYDKIYSAIKIFLSLNDVFKFLDTMNDREYLDEVKKMRLPSENKSIQVLTYLIIKGVSDEAVAECKRELRMDNQTWNSYISHLTTRGLLIKDNFKQSRRNIEPNLHNYCKAILNNDNIYALIKF